MANASTKSIALNNNSKDALGAPKLINIQEKMITNEIIKMKAISENEF